MRCSSHVERSHHDKIDRARSLPLCRPIIETVDEPEHAQGPPDPAEAYAPFSPLEIKRLQRYADRVHAFEQTDFARVETIGLTLTGEVGKETTATVSGFTDQVLKQALMELRPLWLQEEPAGFQQSQALVKRHAYEKGTDAGREAIEHVKNHTRYLDSILNGPTPIQLREIRVGPGRRGRQTRKQVDARGGSSRTF